MDIGGIEMDANKILNYSADTGRRYLTYVMAVLGICQIIGLFIPVTVKVFGMKVAGPSAISDVTAKAIIVLIVAVAFIVVSQLKMYWGIPAVAVAIANMIVVGSLLSKNYLGVDVGGGLGIVKAARIFMLIAAILNAGLLVFKEFVLDKKAQ
jgi:hypothetical protein